MALHTPIPLTMFMLRFQFISILCCATMISGSALAIVPEEILAEQIDQQFAELWKRKGMTPSKLCTDGEFLRRAYLYVNGRVPTLAEAETFLKDETPDKRNQVINGLVGGPGYAEHWANVWTIRLNGRQRDRENETLFYMLYDWFEEQLTSNTSYDVIADQLISAQGSSSKDKSIAFLARWSESPQNMAGRVSKVFLGVRMQCAQCHDHPYEDVKQEEFWETAAFFQGIRVQRPPRQRRRSAPWRLSQRGNGRLRIPDTDKTLSARYILGDAPIAKPAERRRVLSNALTAADNRYFSLALVNWMWAQFMGRGMINPVDDMSLGSRQRPMHRDAYNLLTDDFIAANFDLQRLTRVIMKTEIFQRSTEPNGTNRFDRTYLSKALPRAMTPEQLMNSIVEIGGFNDMVTNSMSRGGTGGQYVRRLRQQMKTFITLYDNDEMGEALDFQGTIPQALFMMNSDIANRFVTYQDSPISNMAESRDGMKTRMEELSLRILSRPATAGERRRFRNHVNNAESKLQGFQDVAWVMLNSTEFFYIH